jgi:hypothetical protein
LQLRYVLRCPFACLIVLAASLFVGMSWAQTEATVYHFKGSPGGANPYAGLIADSKGNGYGTTFEGGSTNCLGGRGCGTAYKITSSGKETVMHVFAGGTTDGCYPYGPLVIDKSGNLYGLRNHIRGWGA